LTPLPRYLQSPGLIRSSGSPILRPAASALVGNTQIGGRAVFTILRGMPAFLKNSERTIAGPKELFAVSDLVCARTATHYGESCDFVVLTPSQDPVYLLFWVLTADTTPHWILVSNAVRQWSSRILSINPTIVRSRVLEFTKIAMCYRKTDPAMPQAGAKFSLHGQLPRRLAQTRHPFLSAADSMELRRSTTRNNSDCHRTAGTMAAPHTILRILHEHRLFTIKSDCTHNSHTVRHTYILPVGLR